MQFVPAGEEFDPLQPVRCVPVDDAEIEVMLASLGRAPLGIDAEHEFRISIAGAQEKTALLRHHGGWLKPIGTTPTTHIFKPQLGGIPTPWGMIDLNDSVENEHYCLTLLGAFGLPAARTEIATFGTRKVLVVERFDRRWRSNDQLLRLPQEDFCQALSTPSGRKYQNQGGPGLLDLLTTLRASDQPLLDRAMLLKSRILFWLIGAIEGHAKNFSIFLRRGGRFQLTPFYDVLSAQPALNAGRIPHGKYKLAMSMGSKSHYKILDIHGRHFVESARAAGLAPALIRQVVEEVRGAAETAAEQTWSNMPEGFSRSVHDSISAAIKARLLLLASADEAL